ncbi:peptide transporter [Methanocella sp. CWC-04]|uniref:Peptide transporter n=1 Tax=Methanooceanicella nereidis TaxID=2052831 RepID=A0AAP2REG2_9EURY|nr:OPT/YSL family transporter [Methanocella sp. CWC-04]MCD1295672.1 peptide transporter [Methanocella sp. CWC-04]
MDERILAVVMGILFSIINAVVVVFLTLKAGISVGLEIFFLFAAFAVFALLKNVRSRGFLYMVAIGTGSTGIVISYTEGLGAIMISGKPFDVPDPVMILLPLLSGIIGVLLSYYFTDYFLKADFPWPGARVNSSLINLFSQENKNTSFRSSAVRMGTAGILSGLVTSLKGFGIRPEILGSINLGLSTSPMFAGIGMLIGTKACLEIAGGAVISLLIWIFLEGASTDYFTHMRNPWVFSTAISMLVTTAVISLYVVLRSSAGHKSKKAGANSLLRDGGNNIAFNSTFFKINNRTLLLTLAVISASMLLYYFPGVPVLIFLVSLPISLLFMIIESRGRAETSMSVGISSFVIILLVGLAFSDIVPLLILEGFVLAMIFSFSLTFYVLKQAEFCNASSQGLIKMLLLGCFVGSVICVPCIKFFNSIYGIGTELLPAPYSIMWLEMAQSAVTKVVPPSVNIFLIAAGALVALILYRKRISAITFSIGLILPFSTCATIILGGLIAWCLEKKNYLKDDNGITASGLIAGDVLVNILLSLRYL